MRMKLVDPENGIVDAIADGIGTNTARNLHDAAQA
jgi:hypothetical protein